MDVSISDSFFGCGGGGGLSSHTGSDIRYWSPRPITGKGARTPSWDCVGLVLDKGESFHLLSLSSCAFCGIEHHPSNGSTSACALRAWRQHRGRKVNSRSRGFHSGFSFSSRAQSPSPHLRGFHKNQMFIACFLSPFFIFAHRSHPIMHHISSVVTCARCLNGYRAFGRVHPGLAHKLRTWCLVY